MKYYARDGAEIEMREYAALFDDRNYQRLAISTVGDLTISTVWLGIDHNFGRGDPVIFETMVFGRDVEEYCVRYSTEAEAYAGHTAMVKKCERNLVKKAREATGKGK